MPSKELSLITRLQLKLALTSDSIRRRLSRKVFANRIRLTRFHESTGITAQWGTFALKLKIDPGRFPRLCGE